MSSYICTQCGYHITVEEGVKVGTCPACQSLFVFPNQFKQKENLYRLAAEARLGGNYDMALNYYSRILKVDAAEPEANWGYLLSKYGIDISNDALDYGNVLFHRVEHTSFIGDPAYEKMIAYVPQESRYYYEGKSREIESQHKKLLAISAAIQAPDIYIDCTAQPGTQDFLLSAQVGKVLEDAGYRVFHPGMLSGVARRDYNLYEMAASEKAQAMIVVFTGMTQKDDVRFQAVWKRFLAYRKQDAGRKMLSVFQGLRPQDLPLELQALQSILCEGTDFSDKVLNEINAMFGRQSRSAELVRKNLNLLRKGQEALDSKAFEMARDYFEMAISNDAQEYRAHWGRACALTKGLTEPLLSDELDQSYRQALALADKATAARYREAMSELMRDTVWARLRTETGDFQDWSEEAEEKSEKAIERVNLYLPPMDPRFQELEDWRQAIRRQREMDDLREAYINRDASVEPLFAEQDKAEYAYSIIRIGGGVIDFSGVRLALYGVSLICLIASYLTVGYVVEAMNGSSAFGVVDWKVTGFTFLSRLLMLGGLCVLGFCISTYFGEGMGVAIFPALLIALLLCFIAGYSAAFHVRLRQIFVGGALAALVFDRLYVILTAGQAVKASKDKVKAWKTVEEITDRLRDSYDTAMEEICARYSIPPVQPAPYPDRHSQNYKEPKATKKKAKGSFGYLVRTILLLVILAAYYFVLKQYV